MPRLTDTLVKSALSAGVSHITIHGRTRHQASTEPVNLDSIKFAVECAQGQVPCVANGDLWELSDATTMREVTGVKGVMAARGLLAKWVDYNCDTRVLLMPTAVPPSLLDMTRLPRTASSNLAICPWTMGSFSHCCEHPPLRQADQCSCQPSPSRLHA